MKKIIPVVAVMIMIAACKKDSVPAAVTGESSRADIITFDNYPGKYASIKIGTQKWMTKNLDVTHYRNGDKIPQVRGNHAWAALTTGAWCWYNNDSATGAVYGKLYNWYAVHDPRGLATVGWHVPSDAEWGTLSAHLGGDSKAGGKLKDTGTIEAGTGLWYAPNTDATNSSGFTGLPGGFRYGFGTFDGVGGFGYWWSSTEFNTSNAWDRNLFNGDGVIFRFYDDKRIGFSVRCLRD